MLRLKGCPRCKGDTVIEKDRYGWHEHCLQCGYIRDLMHRAENKEPAPKAKEELMQVP